jgi:uncharacterized protein YfcZ (UPF0381/DUF406 family)
MKPQELRELISQPESDMLEYKTNLPDLKRVARLISAFANTKGGTLIVGVKEGVESNEIVGIDDLERATKILEQARARVSPPIDIRSEVVTVDEKQVLVAAIPTGKHPPHLVEDKAFQREDDRLVPMSTFAPDIHRSAYQAVTSGSGAIAQGSGAVAAGIGGIVVGGDIGGQIVTGRDFYAYDAAFERVAGTTAFVLSQLELSYRQTREQAQGWFRFSLIAAALGFLLVGVGVIAVIIGQMKVGVITAVSSVVPDVAAALFFFQSKAANERVDVIQRKLGDARKVHSAVEIVETITDAEERDKLKAEIVRKALRIKQDSELKSEEA